MPELLFEELGFADEGFFFLRFLGGRLRFVTGRPGIKTGFDVLSFN